MKVEISSGHQLQGSTPGPKSITWTKRIPEKMQLHSENCWKGCPTNRAKTPKSGRRISGHLPTLIFIIYGLLKMSSGLTVPDPDPELMNVQNFNFAKPKLFFKNIGRYAATSTYIHVRIPFNFTTVIIIIIINHIFDPKCNITIQNKFHCDSYDWESLINFQW
jgi:hypothetical protein